MKGVIRNAVLRALDQTIKILESDGSKNVEELKQLSDDVIEEVALYKDLDIISVTVLIYSLYKVISCVPKENTENILVELRSTRKQLKENNLGRYNKGIKTLFNLVRNCNAKVKIHLRDVMHAARIKKSAVLLKKGLSIGQAAGLMGLSNWDLQQYAGKTTYLFQHHERVPVKKRLLTALKIFGIS